MTKSINQFTQNKKDCGKVFYEELYSFNERLIVLEKRNISIDFIKIISMFMIIILHLSYKGGLISGAKMNSINYYSFYFILIICFIAVNLFAAVSGYLMINSKWKLKNLISLWLTVIFYSYLILFIGKFILGFDINTALMVDSLFPMSRNIYWYFSAYFGLYLLIPLINLGIKGLTKQQMRAGLIIIFILGTISTIFKSNPFGLDLGYSVLWLACMYFVGAYIRLHIDTNSLKVSSLIIKYLVSVFALFGVVLLTSYANVHFFTRARDVTWFIKYASPFVYVSSIYFFLLALKIPFKNPKINKLILFLSPLTFSVYLLHTHPIIFENLFDHMASKFSNYPLFLAIGIELMLALVIYLSCSFIDFGRSKLFKLLKINLLSEKIATGLTNLTKIIIK